MGNAFGRGKYADPLKPTAGREGQVDGCKECRAYERKDGETKKARKGLRLTERSFDKRSMKEPRPEAM